MGYEQRIQTVCNTESVEPTAQVTPKPTTSEPGNDENQASKNKCNTSSVEATTGIFETNNHRINKFSKQNDPASDRSFKKDNVAHKEMGYKDTNMKEDAMTNNEEDVEIANNDPDDDVIMTHDIEVPVLVQLKNAEDGTDHNKATNTNVGSNENVHMDQKTFIV